MSPSWSADRDSSPVFFPHSSPFLVLVEEQSTDEKIPVEGKESFSMLSNYVFFLQITICLRTPVTFPPNSLLLRSSLSPSTPSIRPQRNALLFLSVRAYGVREVCHFPASFTFTTLAFPDLPFSNSNVRFFRTRWSRLAVNESLDFLAGSRISTRQPAFIVLLRALAEETAWDDDLLLRQRRLPLTLAGLTTLRSPLFAARILSPLERPRVLF